MKKKVVCITGGYGSLGLCFARAFGAAGFEIVLTGRNEKKLEKAAEEVKGSTCRVDVSDPVDVDRLRAFLDERFGRLDVLINNAGIMRFGSLSEMAPEVFLETLKTNLFGPFLCSAKLLPLMQSGTNAIIFNVSSTSGHRADPGTSAYNASKFGLMGFTESVRKELRKDNIRVTSISPSAIHFDEDAPDGKGARLNGKDIAELAVYVSQQPGRTLMRDLELWATNP